MPVSGIILFKVFQIVETVGMKRRGGYTGRGVSVPLRGAAMICNLQ